MAEKYLFISGIFTLVLLIDILFYWKTKKMSIPEHKYTTINTCLFIYVSAFLSLVGYLFFFGEKNGSLECRSETMTCEFHYSTPLLYPNKRLAQTFDISNVRRASVKKSTFLHRSSYTVVLHEDEKEISLPMKYTEIFRANRISGSFNRFLSQKESYFLTFYHTYGIPMILFGPLCLIIFFCENTALRRLMDLWTDNRKSPNVSDPDRNWEKEARETFREEGCSEEEIDKLINEIYEEDKLYENSETTGEEDIDNIINEMKESETSSLSGLNIPDDVIQRSRRE